MTQQLEFLFGQEILVPEVLVTVDVVIQRVIDLVIAT